MSTAFLTSILASALFGGVAVYGKPMPEGEPVSIARALAEPGAHTMPAKFEGRIAKVCQSKGCWLILEEDGRWARVMTKHQFFVPKEASGRAVVYGALSEVEVDEKQARHLAEEDGGGEPILREFRVVAESIEIRD